MQHTITMVAESQVQCSNGQQAMVVASGLTTQQAVGKLRQLHAQQAWGTELNHPSYAALHYAGLAAIEQLAVQGNGYHLVPVQFGVLVVT